MSMAYTLGNKCPKNLCKRTHLVQLIIETMVTCFLMTQCILCNAIAFINQSNCTQGIHDTAGIVYTPWSNNAL